MTDDHKNVLRYWRTSLADSTLGEGKFTSSDKKRFIDVPGDAVKSGVLTLPLVNRLFKDRPADTTVDVRFWPLVMARRTSHAATRGGGLPDLVAPVVTGVRVTREGKMTPLSSVLARDLLTPLPSGEFSIGSPD